jgi:ABC-type transporter Mla subunit MlaD
MLSEATAALQGSVRPRLERWVESSQQVTRLLRDSVADYDRLCTQAQAVQQQCQDLRRELEEAGKVFAAVLDSLRHGRQAVTRELEIVSASFEYSRTRNGEALKHAEHPR